MAVAVRPVDSLTMLPRLNEAGRHIQQHEQQPYAFQQVLGANLQEKAQRERMQVRQKDRSEQHAVAREKQGGGSGKGTQGESRRRPREEQGRPAAAGGQSGRLDVKV